MSNNALAGLRVVDLTSMVAGPYCTKMLASLGAEVIKIEQPGVGDEARRMGPFLVDDPHPEKSGVFLYLNTGKKSVTLDISTATGRGLLLQLVGDADILIESHPPKEMAAWGLTYEAMESISPGIVVTSVTDFGQEGPYRDYRAEDIVASAYGGHLYMTGEPDREPLRNGGYQAWYQTGLVAFLGTMSAVLARRLTGRGQHVDISAMEAVASNLEHATIVWSYCKEVNGRTGNHFQGWPAWGIYPARNGHVVVCAGGRDAFLRFAHLMEEPRLGDPKFSAARQRYREEIDGLMLPWLLSHDKEEIYAKAQELHLPFGIVSTTEDLANSSQLQARGYFVDIEHPTAGMFSYPGSPFIMSETPLSHRRAPTLGEHNEEILCGRLGLSHSDLARLRQSGVI